MGPDRLACTRSWWRWITATQVLALCSGLLKARYFKKKKRFVNFQHGADKSQPTTELSPPVDLTPGGARDGRAATAGQAEFSQLGVAGVTGNMAAVDDLLTALSTKLRLSSGQPSHETSRYLY